MTTNQLFSKLAIIQSNLKSIPESGVNSFHNYRYATLEDVINTVRPACSARGIFLSLSCTSAEILKEGRAASCLVTLLVIDAETGEQLTMTMPGYAEDAKSDKSIWKAITGASKYALRTFFCLAAGDEPERTEAQDTRPMVIEKPIATNGQKVVIEDIKRASFTGESSPVNTARPVGSGQSTHPSPDTRPNTTKEQQLLIDETTLEMRRLEWSDGDGRAYLAKNFNGKTSRAALTFDELNSFLGYLRSLSAIESW